MEIAVDAAAIPGAVAIPGAAATPGAAAITAAVTILSASTQTAPVDAAAIPLSAIMTSAAA